MAPKTFVDILEKKKNYIFLAWDLVPDLSVVARYGINYNKQ